MKEMFMKKESEINYKSILSDEEIIELYWKRQEKAISATDDKYGKYLYTIAYNILYNRMDCEECINDTYLSTWNSIPPHRPSVFQVFLSRITRNTAVDQYRKSTAAKRIPSELVTSLDELDECITCSPSPEEEYRIKELGETLNAYIQTLSDREQFIFVCRYFYSDSIAIIAKMLCISERTVTRELKEIRENMKVYFEKEGYRI